MIESKYSSILQLPITPHVIGWDRSRKVGTITTTRLFLSTVKGIVLCTKCYHHHVWNKEGNWIIANLQHSLEFAMDRIKSTIPRNCLSLFIIINHDCISKVSDLQTGDSDPEELIFYSYTDWMTSWKEFKDNLRVNLVLLLLRSYALNSDIHIDIETLYNFSLHSRGSRLV